MRSLWGLPAGFTAVDRLVFTPFPFPFAQLQVPPAARKLISSNRIERALFYARCLQLSTTSCFPVPHGARPLRVPKPESSWMDGVMVRQNIFTTLYLFVGIMHYAEIYVLWAPMPCTRPIVCMPTRPSWASRRVTEIVCPTAAARHARLNLGVQLAHDRYVHCSRVLWNEPDRHRARQSVR